MSFLDTMRESTTYIGSYTDGYKGKTVPAAIPRGAPWKTKARPLGLHRIGLNRFSPWRPLEWVNNLYRVLPWWL